ncbi:hypothetical protein Q0Z83_019130 [Actinoplanes sichuanensis]|uniref:Toxin-antitoxin system HicB family antitoxin n=1 Tax=Actinoplanes sichuanensis TaxID=512349 RepID=A0ABW4AIX0_9ACTN|nr:toxin-antitoxin system HicB family antitoxin [Actinoplanes sichuanensis]BEL03722.1 hypothetical protein Q0Z83_019130 [Actinoplanes sichuanensis]
MELRPYIDALRHELALAAAAGGEDARELAERLTAPLESATRLALLDALSEAAAEITRDLAPGSVDLRLRNREPSFVVTPAPADVWTDETPAPPPPDPIPATAPSAAPGEDEATVRISLRLPEHLKNRIDQAAARSGVSINTWLIRAASAAADGDRPATPTTTVTATSGGQRFTGWVR